MSTINPGYLDLFQQVLPKHEFESTAVNLEHEQVRILLGTGPFVITDWKTGDQITYEPNANYREAGKPYLEGITVKVTPEKEAAIAAFVNGDLPDWSTPRRRGAPSSSTSVRPAPASSGSG